MQTIYSIRNLRILLFYIMIPLLIVLILFFIFSRIYIKKRENKDSNKTNYVLNYWGDVLGIIFSTILLSVSIGFAAALMKTLRDLNAISENIVFYYAFALFPIIPFIFMYLYIKKFIRNINKKEKLEEEMK